MAGQDENAPAQPVANGKDVQKAREDLRKREQGTPGVVAEAKGREPLVALSNELDYFADTVANTFSSLHAKTLEQIQIHDDLTQLKKRNGGKMPSTNQAVDLANRFDILRAEIVELNAKLEYPFSPDLSQKVKAAWKSTPGGQKLVRVGTSAQGKFDIQPVLVNGEFTKLRMVPAVKSLKKVNLGWGGKVLKTVDETPQEA
jgi:hypothetical protein